MEKILIEIIKNYKSNDYFPNGIGLINGKTGLGLAYFILSKYTKDPTLTDKGFDMFDAITEDITRINEINFSNGLSGIGWAIEWLVQNDFFEANTDEILEDVDNAIYKALMFAPDNNLSLGNGTLGKLLYFFKRMKSINTNVNRFKTITHETCLIVLTDELHDELIGDNGLLKKIKENSISIDLRFLGQVIVLLSDFLNSKINEPTVETILYETIKVVSEILKAGDQNLGKTNTVDFKFLAVCYFIAGKNHTHHYWQEQARAHIDLLNSMKYMTSTNIDIIIPQLKVYSLVSQYFPEIVNISDCKDSIFKDILDTNSLQSLHISGNLLPFCNLGGDINASAISELQLIYY